MNAIILCGGLSTRLGEITKAVPKVLLEIKGKTVLEWQLKKLQRLGITEVVLSAGHLAGVLEKQAGLHYAGMDLIYAIEDIRLGTGGAIKHAWEYVTKREMPAVILNGDILTTVDFKDMVSFLRPTSDGMILGVQVPDAATYGTLVFEKNYHLLSFKEKEGKHIPGFINGGVYIFNPVAKKYFPSERVFSVEYDVFPKMNNLDVYASNKPWIDIGVPDRLAWARENWVE